jgi:hypothetical protein
VFDRVGAAKVVVHIATDCMKFLEKLIVFQLVRTQTLMKLGAQQVCGR